MAETADHMHRKYHRVRKKRISRSTVATRRRKARTASYILGTVITMLLFIMAAVLLASLLLPNSGGASRLNRGARMSLKQYMSENMREDQEVRELKHEQEE